MIASDTGQNRLRTGTLGFSDVENHADYSAASAGLSLGGTAGSPPAPSNSGPSSGHNTGGLSPMIPQYSSDSQRGATRSAVAAGTIEVTDTAHQTQDLASLSRETSDTHRTVERNPDLQHTLDQQANLMAAAQAAGEAVLKTVGDIAKAQREAAMEKAAAAYAKGGQEQFQQALDEAHQWGEGGRYRNALHAAGGALVAGLGGGNALAGAAGAGLSSALAPELDRWASEVANSLSTGSADLDQALGNAAANLAAGGLGALVGGGSGAASAANVDRFNRQLHEDAKANEQTLAKELARQSNGLYNEQQVANALRTANNSALGETIATGMVIPLDGNTPAGAVYDPTGMQLVTDGSTGNRYLVQEPSMLNSPSQALRDLIRGNTGGENSPYNWDVPAPGSIQANLKSSMNPHGPFSPGWNTGDYSAGLGAPGRGILPDYATTGTSVLSLSGAGAINLHDGSTYLSGGVTQNFPISTWKPGVTATVGWIFGAQDANATSSFLNGDGKQGFVSIPTPFKFNVVGAVTRSYSCATAIEVGVGSPGGLNYGVTPWSHSESTVNGK